MASNLRKIARSKKAGSRNPGLGSAVLGCVLSFTATGIARVQTSIPVQVTFTDPDGKKTSVICDRSCKSKGQATVEIVKIIPDAELKKWADKKGRQIGDNAPDGSKYAGISPATGTHMFAMPQDSGEMSWNEAIKFSQTMVAYGHKGSKQATAELLKDASKDDGGWRMPTLEESDVLFKNKDKIGGFASRWYWSSSECLRYDAGFQRFGDGKQFYATKFWAGGAVRSVRSLARER